MKKVKKFIIELYHILNLPEMLILPGNLAFFLFLSLIPIITLIGLLASWFSLSTGSLIELVTVNLPAGVSDILLPFIDGTNINAGNILFILVCFFLASNGTDSLIKASNLLYKVPNQNYIFRRVKALFMTFWLMLLIVVILLVLAFGNVILAWLLKFEVLGNFIMSNYLIITILKYLITFVFAFIIIKILYTMAPDVKMKSKYTNRGALFSTVVIILVTAIYSFYVSNIVDYNIMYGSLANLAILMFLIYLISYIIVLGIAINNKCYENITDKTV